jgi:menaquinone-dependent protoporphyrinogen oxidase
MKTKTRRAFLIDSAKWAGGALSALTLGNTLLFPGTVRGEALIFPKRVCGSREKGVPRILIAYASRYASTGGVAERIGRVLCEKGASTDVRLIDDAIDVHAYDAVVIGSAVQRGKWLPEAVRFVGDNRRSLRQIPVAYFLTCLAASRPNPAAQREARSYMDFVLAEVPDVRPAAKGIFAGVLDYGKMSFVIRAVMKSKMKDKGIPEGDYREWNRISGWAEGVFPKLHHQSEAASSRPSQTAMDRREVRFDLTR